MLEGANSNPWMCTCVYLSCSVWVVGPPFLVRGGASTPTSVVGDIVNFPKSWGQFFYEGHDQLSHAGGSWGPLFQGKLRAGSALHLQEGYCPQASEGANSTWLSYFYYYPSSCLGQNVTMAPSDSTGLPHQHEKQFLLVRSNPVLPKIPQKNIL